MPRLGWAMQRLVSRRQRKKVEMLFAHLKRILRLDRLRLRGPNGARDDTGAEDSADTPGRDWDTTVWLFKGHAGMPVGVEVWHDHHVPAAVGHAQFVATTWDY